MEYIHGLLSVKVSSSWKIKSIRKMYIYNFSLGRINCSSLVRNQEPGEYNLIRKRRDKKGEEKNGKKRKKKEKK